jgi:hypothetical protein
MTATSQTSEASGPTTEPVDIERTATQLAALLALLRRLNDQSNRAST